MADRRSTAYDLLGVSPKASSAEITRAYRRLLRRHHPDSRDASQVEDGTGDPPVSDAAGALGMILEAYGVLRDPRSRADYDRRLGMFPPTSNSVRVVNDRDSLVSAGPVRWDDGRTLAGRAGTPTVSELELELLRRLVGVLYSRWSWW